MVIPGQLTHGAGLRLERELAVRLDQQDRADREACGVEARRERGIEATLGVEIARQRIRQAIENRLCRRLQRDAMRQPDADAGLPLELMCDPAEVVGLQLLGR